MIVTDHLWLSWGCPSLALWMATRLELAEARRLAQAGLVSLVTNAKKARRLETLLQAKLTYAAPAPVPTRDVPLLYVDLGVRPPECYRIVIR